MKKLKIIHTLSRFYPYVGGVEKYVLDLATEQVKNGHEVTVICSDECPHELNTYNGIKIIRLKYICKITNTNITLSLPFILFKKDFDIIHTHIPTPWSADFSALASFLKRKPLVVT